MRERSLARVQREFPHLKAVVLYVPFWHRPWIREAYEVTDGTRTVRVREMWWGTLDTKFGHLLFDLRDADTLVMLLERVFPAAVGNLGGGSPVVEESPEDYEIECEAGDFI